MSPKEGLLRGLIRAYLGSLPPPSPPASMKASFSSDNWIGASFLYFLSLLLTIPGSLIPEACHGLSEEISTRPFQLVTGRKWTGTVPWTGSA